MNHYQPGRDGPMFCPMCCRSMPFHSEYGCVMQPSATIDGWTCKTLKGIRRAVFTDGTIVLWTPKSELTIMGNGTTITISTRLLSWLLAFRGAPETMHSFESKWVDKDK